jgi:hypothetical protein
MKLKDCREAYYYYSGKTSDILRYIGYAGLAIVWVFRITKEGQTIIPHNLVWCGIFLLCGLVFDILQCLIATVIWGSYHRYKEKQKNISEDTEIKAPRYINWPANTFFALKAIAMVAAYCVLIKFLFDSFWMNSG